MPADALSPGAGRLRLLLGAFGDPGHAFPMIALGRALAARGHDVVLQTWRRWEEHVVAEGIGFAPAPEYHVFPTRDRPLKPYEAVVRAARDTRPLVAEVRPHAVVADILTLAPALAGELEGVPVATLVTHLDPRGAPGFPPYSIGARLPRTRLGRRMWAATDRVVAIGLETGRRELNETRARLGLPPVAHVHGNRFHVASNLGVDVDLLKRTERGGKDQFAREILRDHFGDGYSDRSGYLRLRRGSLLAGTGQRHPDTHTKTEDDLIPEHSSTPTGK